MFKSTISMQIFRPKIFIEYKRYLKKLWVDQKESLDHRLYNFRKREKINFLTKDFKKKML